MSRLKHSSLLTGVAVLVLAGPAFATLYFDPTESSGVTYTHDPNLNVAGIALPTGTLVGTGALGTSDPLSIGGVPTAFGPNYQFRSTDTRPSGGGSSIGVISISRVSNASTLGVKVAAGTGVTQANPTGAYTGSSSLRADIDATWYTDSNFGPVNGSAAFTVGGTLGSGAGATASFLTTLHFYKVEELEITEAGTAELGVADVALRSPIVFNHTWVRGTGTNNATTTYIALGASGLFSKSFSSSARLSSQTGGIIAAESTIELLGSIEFQAKNDGSPTEIGLSSVGGTFVGPVPEPVTASLGALALLGLGASATRRRARA